MTNSRWDRINEIFHRALSLPEAQQASYLDDACADDDALLAEVRSLIDAHRKSDDFLEEPAGSIGGLSDPPSPGDVAGRRFGPYRVLRELGHGGMGAVYLAERTDEVYQKKVAIKTLLPGLRNPQMQRRFQTERQALANVDHPHIAKLLDGCATEDGLPYLVMEYVDGLPIDKHCDQDRLSIRERLQLFQTVCSAIERAHRSLIVHRDIKCGNILVTADGEAKLLDFGIAKIVDPDPDQQSEATQTAVPAMTPSYASPEQVRGGPITTATDVYSLGIVLYRLLTGRHTYEFTGLTPGEIERVVCETPPPPPSVAASSSFVRKNQDGNLVTVAPDDIARTRKTTPWRLQRVLMGDLDHITLMALRKEPQRRYGSVQAFSQDIEKYLTGLPVTAQPDSMRYRLGKAIRRNKTAVVAGVLIAICLISGIAATTWQAVAANRARARAERRFNDVRDLAKFFLYDFHDEIRDLPGSTRPRKLLVERSLTYLDDLAKEAGNDTTLLRELADAYQRVGDVQGHPHKQNLGDLAGARSSYQKMLEIRNRLVASAPNDAGAQSALADAQGLFADVLWWSGDTEEAIKYYRKQLASRKELAQRNPRDWPTRLALAEAFADLGVPLDWAGEAEENLRCQAEARTILRALVNERPADASAQSLLATTYIRSADTQFWGGQAEDAVASLQHALEIHEKLAEGRPGSAQSRHLWIVHLRLGQCLMNTDLAEAERHQTKAMHVAKQLAAADPNDMRARRDLYITYSTLAQIQASQDKNEEAIESSRQALRLLDEVSTEDEKSVSRMVDRGNLQSVMGSLFLKLSDLSGALESYQDALRTRQEVVELSPDERLLRGPLADTYCHLGTVLQAQAENETEPKMARDLWELALEHYNKSHTMLSKLLESGDIGESFREQLKLALDGIEACEEALQTRTGTKEP